MQTEVVGDNASNQNTDQESTPKAGVILTFSSQYIFDKFVENDFENKLNLMVANLANVERSSFDD